MRLTVIAVALLFALTFPAAAQSAGRSFGSVTCSQHVPCPGYGSSGNIQGLANAANFCVSHDLGVNSISNFFDPSAGLNEDACLTAIPGVIPKGMGAQLSPLCCIVKLTSSVCVFRCSLVTTQ